MSDPSPPSNTTSATITGSEADIVIANNGDAGSHDCIFCKIAKKEAPANIIYEDENVMAFLGHTLVIPKYHYRNLASTPPLAMSHLGSVLPRIARAVCEAVDAPDFNVMQNNGIRAGQVVFHLHFHIMPRHPTDAKKFQGFKRLKRERINGEEAGSLEERIKARL
ncbi:HIT-like domain-containing protein [Jimgerdemannia flammicorona]|uniref:HIT-like domain-containing protein n=1 Tax=Jimgerdemannia flammicorona TaxID=994334 RepID=A0A433QNN8_9FUNG|nr:HIT-like domain-containing protein [Jimgerdemannia flammicorona]